MPKSKKNESLKRGDIVRQGRARQELRVLQVNKGSAVLVETVKNGSDEYATFYAPKEDLTVVKASSTGGNQSDVPPAGEKSLFQVVFQDDAGNRHEVEVEAVREDEAVEIACEQVDNAADVTLVSVDVVKPV